MSQQIPIYIPTYISDAAYKPARVLPRLLFYNGLVDCETWYLESGSLTESGVTIAQSAFPYFDNYDVVSGSFPTIDSNSLLFQNENTSYGTIPSGSLYSQYWEKYITLLYNPKTRLLNCSAIIPLADYTKMELNDIVNFRGNYYHLRAINDYSLKTGECNLQLLGPIIPDVFDSALANTPATIQCCAPTLNSVTESPSGTINLNFTLGDGGVCDTCAATTIQKSYDGVNFGSNNTAGCTSPRTLSAEAVPVWYRIITNCAGGTTSSPSNAIRFESSLVPVPTYIEVTDGYSADFPTDCLGQSYTTTQNVTIATLLDQFNNPINASSNVTVTVEYNVNPCFGGGYTSNADITILGGTSGGFRLYTSSTYVDCGFGSCQFEGESFSTTVSNSLALPFV
jgi:hypothetical protein